MIRKSSIKLFTTKNLILIFILIELIFLNCCLIGAESVNEWNYTGLNSLPKWTESKFFNDAKALVTYDNKIESPYGNGALKILIITPGTATKDIQVYPVKKGIIEGAHNVKIMMKANRVMHEELQLTFGEIGGVGYALPGVHKIMLTDSWQEYDIKIKALAGFENKKLRMPGIYCGLLSKETIIYVALVSLDGGDVVKQIPLKTTTMDSVSEKSKSSINIDSKYMIIPAPRILNDNNSTIDASIWDCVEGYSKASEMFINDALQITKNKSAILANKSEKKNNLIFIWCKNGNQKKLKNNFNVEKVIGAYNCSISADGCIINAYDKQGLYNGIQSVLTIIENNEIDKIPCLTISDYPIIKNRAILLPIFASITIDFLKEFVRRSARYKYTEIYLQPKGNIELVKNPNIFLPQIKQSEIRELVTLGKQYNISIIPEIKCLSGFNFNPGEDGAQLEKNIESLLEPPSPNAPNWVKRDRVNKRIKLTFKMENEDVYKLIFSVMDELYELFDCPKKIHTGFDEGWDFAGSGYDKPNDVLLANHIKRINEYFEKKGITMCIWGDQLVNPTNYLDASGNVIRYNLHGGSPFYTAGAIDLIPTNILINSWHYVPQEKYTPVRDVKNHGFITYGVTWNAPANIITMAKEVVAYNADGLMGTLWSIHLPRNDDDEIIDKDTGLKRKTQEYEVLPITAEAAWNPNAAEENIKRYDGYAIMKKYFTN